MGSDRVVNLSTLKLGEFFAENEPFYLSIGLSHEEYWNGEPRLARLALRAFNLKREREVEQLNYSNWLLGMYVESAVCSVVGNIFSKDKQYKSTYPERPFPITEDETEEYKNKQKQDEKKKAMEWIMNLTTELDKQFNNK